MWPGTHWWTPTSAFCRVARKGPPPAVAAQGLKLSRHQNTSATGTPGCQGAGSDSANSPPSQIPLPKGRLSQRQCCTSLEILSSLEHGTGRSPEVTGPQNSRTKNRVPGHTAPGNHQRPAQPRGGSAVPRFQGLRDGQTSRRLCPNTPDTLTPSYWKMFTRHKCSPPGRKSTLKKERLFSAPSPRMHICIKSPAFT